MNPPRRFRRRVMHGLVGAALCLALPTVASGQEPKKETVSLEVWTIRATQSNSDVSRQLKPLAEKLKQAFRFTGYKLVKTDSRTVKLGDEYRTALISPFEVVITPESRSDDQVKLKVVVSERKGDKVEKRLSTTVSLRRERFQLFGGWKLDGGDVLIMAVSVK